MRNISRGNLFHISCSFSESCSCPNLTLASFQGPSGATIYIYIYIHTHIVLFYTYAYSCVYIYIYICICKRRTHRVRGYGLWVRIRYHIMIYHIISCHVMSCHVYIYIYIYTHILHIYIYIYMYICLDEKICRQDIIGQKRIRRDYYSCGFQHLFVFVFVLFVLCLPR